jgi:hypothetical protein
MAITAERDLSKVGPNQVRRIEEDRDRHFSFIIEKAIASFQSVYIVIHCLRNAKLARLPNWPRGCRKPINHDRNRITFPT